MSSNYGLVNLIDNHITYRISTYFYYSVTIFLLYLSFKPDKNPILPNPIMYLICFLVIFTSAQASQVIDPSSPENRRQLIRITLSIIPPFLGSYELYKLGRSLKEKDNDFAIWLNLLLLSLIFFVLGLFLSIVIMLIQITSVPTHALYMLSVGPWMYLPILLANGNYLYNSEIRTDRKKSFFTYTQKLITSTYFTRARRVSIYLIMGLTLVILVIVNNKVKFTPISI